ncbi:MAG TPA: aromatic ring-hydroxylating dioxygenase subunit alpha [Streptosporangiaceae bacterium]|jgi:Rieske 2Fe-2S family protein
MVSQTKAQAPMAAVRAQVVRPPAPVDASELAEALLPFGESRMLPRAAYTEEAVFDWERRHFFSEFMCLGLSAELPSPGDQRAEPAGEGSVLLVRGDDGVLHAFANTCRHRGHELLPCGGQATQKSIICPYHAWTYGLDGTLRGAAGYRHLDKSQWGLTELPVTEWHGLIFTGTLPAELAALGDLVAAYEPERLVIADRHTYDAASNWKILTENYHECYHCPSIHPELCRVSPPKSGENYAATGAWIGGWMDLRDGMATMSLDGTSHGVPLRGLSGPELRTVSYVNIFPNILWSLHPDYVMTHRVVPLSAGRTRIECTWAFSPEAVAKPGFDPAYAVEFWDLTNRQDWAACESVQRGLSSPHAKPGPLSPAEDAVYSFVTTVARRYQGTS